MSGDDEKYERIVSMLRKSKPALESTDEIEEKVISRIRQSTGKEMKSYGILDYLFGWVFIGWVRKGLIMASVLLVLAFGYQQTMIMKRINSLDSQARSAGVRMINGTYDGIDDKLLLYRLSDWKPTDKPLKISNRQMNRLIEEINDLQIKYDDLMQLIEESPDLKKYIGDKITEKNRKKLKL
jgi:hypothetical protein